MGCRRWIGRRSGSVGVLLVGEIEVGSMIGRTLGWNWNWTRSPGCALTLEGEKVRLPLGPPTWTTCVMTMPAIAAGVEVDTLPSTAEERVGSVAEPMDIDMEDSCAHARPKTAERIVALEKYMLTGVCGVRLRKGELGIKYAIRIAMLVSSREWMGD